MGYIITKEEKDLLEAAKNFTRISGHINGRVCRPNDVGEKEWNEALSNMIRKGHSALHTPDGVFYVYELTPKLVM